VRRVYVALPSPFNVAFALGAFAMLRPGEVLGLEWSAIDIAARRINIHQQVNKGRLGKLKDDESRRVPIQKALAPILSEYKLRSGGEGLLFRPAVPGKGGRKAKDGQPARASHYIRPHTLPNRNLRKALAACKILKVPAPTKDDPDATRALTWYECTRHFPARATGSSAAAAWRGSPR